MKDGTGGGSYLYGIRGEQREIRVFTGIDKCKFRRQVVPGDTIRMEVEMIT